MSSRMIEGLGADEGEGEGAGEVGGEGDGEGDGECEEDGVEGLEGEPAQAGSLHSGGQGQPAGNDEGPARGSGVDGGAESSMAGVDDAVAAGESVAAAPAGRDLRPLLSSHSDRVLEAQDSLAACQVSDSVGAASSATTASAEQQQRYPLPSVLTSLSCLECVLPTRKAAPGSASATGALQHPTLGPICAICHLVLAD